MCRMRKSYPHCNGSRNASGCHRKKYRDSPGALRTFERKTMGVYVELSVSAWGIDY